MRGVFSERPADLQVTGGQVSVLPVDEFEHRKNSSRAGDRMLLVAACLLLGIVVITGGSSQQSNLGSMFAQLLAIPVLAYALLKAWRSGRFAKLRWSIAVLALIVLIPVLQLLPLPEWIWRLPSARTSLLGDLAASGVTNVHYRWSLVPAATERDLLSLLPPVALFFAAINFDRDAVRTILRIVVGLALFSLVLGIAQLAAGQQSILNPFPQWEPEMGGIFANPNHQATLFAIALLLSVALMLEARTRAQRGDVARFSGWAHALLIALFAIALPTTGSRAAPIIAIVPTALFVIASGAIPYHRLRHHRPTQLAGLLLAGLLAVGVGSAVAWSRPSKVAELRPIFARQTAMIGMRHAPLGGGIGGFIPLFQQGVDTSVLRDTYINNAHNEYVQLWLEGGVLAIVGMLAFFCVLAFHAVRLLRLPSRSGARLIGLAGTMALLVFVLHSWVDYPLRTPALLALFMLMAGISVSRGDLIPPISLAKNAN